MNRFTLIITATFVTTCMVLSPLKAQQQSDMSLDTLLEQVKRGQTEDNQVNELRITEFTLRKDRQQDLLSNTKREREKAENLSFRQEQEFEVNEQQIGLLEDRLNERLGSLKELFGVLQLVATDAQGQFANSLTQIHYPERAKSLNKFADKMGQTNELPSIEEIELLWFELQREMTESGKLTVSRQNVLTANGEEETRQVTRVGTFNLTSEGTYFQRIPETNQIVEFGRQPASRYMEGASKIEESTGELIPFTIDPIRGQLIAIKGTAPDLRERIAQGGEIGYIIIGLGVISVLVALLRLGYLQLLDIKISKQLHSLEAPGNNPLGRILDVYKNNKSDDVESIELKLSEAVLREVPKVNWGLSFLKISAAVAPLLGLLGTVTGMIITFQAITLFGAGDPKLMAGGISQALVTTVLGLCVAIPTLLLHNLVQGKATKINEILEQESISIIALHAEEQAG